MSDPKPQETPQRSGATACSDAVPANVDYKQDPEWDDDMLYAFESAAGLMDQEEFSGDDAERQMAAFSEVAKRIRAMGKRYEKKMYSRR